uniref:Very-long-chain (3R)-3-hydroxyacyl-CoA dehydratase n=1 Tax=Oryza punctata TaxID=4537 RepID=A0A0E0JE37_ORYPU
MRPSMPLLSSLCSSPRLLPLWRNCEVSNLRNSSTNYFKVISYLGHPVELSGDSPSYFCYFLGHKLIVRYSFFGMKEAFGFAPSWLLWLRYSTFMVLYPTGMISEVGLIYVTLPHMKASQKYCLTIPKKWNFSFDYYYASVFPWYCTFQDFHTCSAIWWPRGRRPCQKQKLMMMVCWFIWKERNARVFNQRSRTSAQLVGDIKDEITIWKQAGLFKSEDE